MESEVLTRLCHILCPLEVTVLHRYSVDAGAVHILGGALVDRRGRGLSPLQGTSPGCALIYVAPFFALKTIKTVLKIKVLEYSGSFILFQGQFRYALRSHSATFYLHIQILYLKVITFLGLCNMNDTEVVFNSTSPSSQNIGYKWNIGFICVPFPII